MTSPARTTTFVVGLDARLRALGMSRYKLAQLSGLHANTINGWWHSTAMPSMESLAKIAPHLGMSQAAVLEMAGQFEPEDSVKSDGALLNALQKDVTRRCQNMVDVVDALDTIPEAEWLPIMKRILDRAEAEIRDTTALLIKVHDGVALPNASRGAPAPAGTVSRRWISPRGRLLRKRHTIRKFQDSPKYDGDYIYQNSSGCPNITAPVVRTPIPYKAHTPRVHSAHDLLVLPALHSAWRQGGMRREGGTRKGVHEWTCKTGC